MKRQVKRWLSVMMVALLAFVNMGAVMVEPVPMEEAEKDGLVEFRNNSLLCDTGCGGYYMQQGEAVLARGLDRTEGNIPAIICSYPLVCTTCQKHIWHHEQIKLYPTEMRDGSMMCDTGCGGHYAQYGQAVLAQGFDRTQNNAPVVFCSYPLACETCGKHIWSHTQVELPAELVEEAAELIW